MKIIPEQTIDNSMRLYNQDVEEIIKAAEAMNKESPELRIGQCLYHQLTLVSAPLASGIVNTKADPFYEDDNINRFLQAITKI